MDASADHESNTHDGDRCAYKCKGFKIVVAGAQVPDQAPRSIYEKDCGEGGAEAGFFQAGA
jgi:hypothetical protein